jgi:hypothetical protein
MTIVGDKINFHGFPPQDFGFVVSAIQTQELHTYVVS